MATESTALVKLDISTEANRKALASLAYKVARWKTFIDDQRKAVEAEKQRRAAEDKRKREEQERRDASARIRKRVLGKISEAIAELGVAPEKADVIASALANGKIPNVTVVF